MLLPGRLQLFTDQRSSIEARQPARSIWQPCLLVEQSRALAQMTPAQTGSNDASSSAASFLLACFFFFLRRHRTAPHCGLLKAREWFRERRVSFCSIFSLSLCSQIRAAIFIQVDDADTNSRHHQTHSITGQLTTQYSTPFLGKLSSLEVVRVGSALNPAYAHLAGCLPRWISFIRLSEACEGFATV